MSKRSAMLGWIGTGRMGYPMAERLLKAGHPLQVWNRTRAKAEPLAALGATLCDGAADLAGVDILFTMVSTGADLEQVLFGAGGVAAGDDVVPRIVVDCSSIGVDQGEAIRARLGTRRRDDRRRRSRATPYACAPASSVPFAPVRRRRSPKRGR